MLKETLLLLEMVVALTHKLAQGLTLKVVVLEVLGRPHRGEPLQVVDRSQLVQGYTLKTWVQVSQMLGIQGKLLKVVVLEALGRPHQGEPFQVVDRSH